LLFEVNICFLFNHRTGANIQSERKIKPCSLKEVTGAEKDEYRLKQRSRAEKICVSKISQVPQTGEILVLPQII